MKRIIATTALALMVSTAAIAQTKMETYKAADQTDIYASKLIGMRIYSAEKDYDNFDENTMVEDDAEREWDDIGEVNDVILGRDGMVKAVVLGVGGFIGIGEKDVAVPMKSIKMVREKDDDDMFLVVKTSKEALTEAEEFMRAEEKMEKKEEQAEAKTDETETAETSEKTGAKMDPDGRPMLAPPPVEREGYRVAKLEELTAEKLEGARVYGLKDEDVGEISKLVLDDGGKITKVVIDVGGFLGIGEKPVGVTFDELSIIREEDGDDFRVYIDSTEEQLKAQPDYRG